MTQRDTRYIHSVRKRNEQSDLKNRRGYRVNDTVGSENVGTALALSLRASDMIGTTRRTLNHDDTTTN